MLRRWGLVPLSVGLIGVGLSCFVFWLAERAEERRVRSELESRSEWRVRDLEAKIRLAGNAVENIAIAVAANPVLDAKQFDLIAIRARSELAHVNSLQWAPRVRRDDVAEFERSVRSAGLRDYRVFDVTPDFQRTDLAPRAEYFPILYEARFRGNRHVQGLALGRHDGRRLPMQKAREEGRPVATLPVRPIGPPTPILVYLLFWPVYQSIESPGTREERHEDLRGFAVGNYDIVALLSAILGGTPDLIETIYFSIAGERQNDVVKNAAVTYSPITGNVELRAEGVGSAEEPAIRIQRHFVVFDQHWNLAFDFSSEAVAALRSNGAWGWLVAGLLLTASLVYYLLHERGRRETIAALVAERTAALEQTSAQLHQAQKMEAIGTMTGGMAHDFNNLLSVVIGNLDLLQDQIKDDRRASSHAEAAMQAAIRGAELTRQLLAFARRQPLEPKIVDINALVVGMSRLLERILEEHIEVTLVTAPQVWQVTIDPAQLSSAIANLATNARDAMPNGGRLTIETRNVHLDADYASQNADVVPGDFVLIEVSDTGVGMPAEMLQRVFEPFFTTKEPGRGTGLGLSMVFGFVKQSRGHIKIYSEVGQGTTVRLYLPRTEGEELAVSPVPEAETEAPQKGHETILVVEDDVDVRRIVTAQLTDLGYSVIEVENARAALALIKTQETTVDLLFTDLVMPGGMSGHELANAALAERPGLRVLFTSGYPGSTLRGDERLKEGEHFLSKPYRKQDLGRKLQEIFDH